MALLAGPLHGNNGQFVGRLLKYDGNKIAQTEMWQEFGVERVSLHLTFVEQLAIPRNVSGALTKRKWNARIQ